MLCGGLTRKTCKVAVLLTMCSLEWPLFCALCRNNNHNYPSLADSTVYHSVTRTIYLGSGRTVSAQANNYALYVLDVRGVKRSAIFDSTVLVSIHL